MRLSRRVLQLSVLISVWGCSGWVFAQRAADGSEDRRFIALNSHVIDTRAARAAAIPEHLRATALAADTGEYALVKFPGPVSAKQLQSLRASVARVYTYLPHDTFLVKLGAGQRRASLSATGVSWSSPYHPYYKISRFVAAVTPEAETAESRGATREMLMLHVYPDADLAKVTAQIKALGIADVVGAQNNTFFSRIRLLVTRGEIVRHREALAQIPEVFWVEHETRRRLLNDTTVWVGQSGLSGGQTTPVFSHGIFGEGQVVGILDTGIDPDMCYFRDPLRGLPPRNECNGGTTIDTAQRKLLAVDFLWSSECSGGISGSEWDTQGHGTHVAGTVAGDNFASPLLHDPGDGMAPGAKLVIQDCGFQTNNCADCPGIGCPVVDLNPIFQQTYTQGARIHTNSWGDNENGAVQNNYTTASQDVDEFMWNHKDFQIFFAAGNSGPGTGSVGSPSTAKSAVSVGATLRGTSANQVASFSSCGPTDDGRIKPEVTIPGSNIVSAANDGSTTSNNCGTRSLSGTSMASPGAAGLTALIRQYYTAGWYPSGTAVSADGFTPSAALMRATLVNSAQPMTGAPVIPGNCQGWGRVLLENALFFAGQTRKLWVKDNAAAFPTGSTNETRTFTFTVATGEPFKASLAWTDFPSTPAANPHINNDLDLTVTGPGGTFLGNVFSGGQSATGGSADRRNTLEQVLLSTPAAGTYTVTVRSFNVPNGPQPFALVVTGNATPAGGNVPPVANAGPDQTVAAGATVTLNGSGSSDPDNGPGPLTFAWSQVSGPSVTITNPNQATATVTLATAAIYVFQLQVSDGAASATDQVSVTASGAVTTVFEDDFETDKGWTVNPNATDTATTGIWERGNPEDTNSGGAKQLGTTTSGVNDLVTARLAGASAGVNDIDGGVTSIRSPVIALPATGTLTLTFRFYLAHGSNATSADFLRVRIVGGTTTTVFERLGAATNVNGAWGTGTASLNAFAGQSVRILIEAADAGTASLVEAGIDDVKVTRQ
jgi:hypothetical protein